MKTLFLLPLLAILFASCSKTDTTSDPLADLATKAAMVVQSNWIITQFTDSGNDQTSIYSGYTFKFNTDGTFIAAASDTSFTGTWILELGSNKSDDNGNVSADDKLNRLTISINGSVLMNHLSHKWLCDKITATEIWLRDDNPASNEFLKFGK
jgi:hypothetical protein